jgi:hypothetical protein
MITELPGQMSVRTSADIDRYLARIIAATRRAQERIVALDINSFELFRLMKFGSIGFHPIDERELNLVEQINQTWSYVAALAAARHRRYGNDQTKRTAFRKYRRAGEEVMGKLARGQRGIGGNRVNVLGFCRGVGSGLSDLKPCSMHARV